MVFVIDKNKKPLAPCHEARARKLLSKKKAKIYKHAPFTIILTYEITDDVEGFRLKVDPGSRYTGLSILHRDTILWLSEIDHKTDIKTNLEKRAGYRRNRRSRKTRYRKARFLNRTKPEGWFPPSVMSRVNNIRTIVSRIMKLTPVTAFSYELVKFDTQLMEDPDIEGREYQKGSLEGMEIREFLLYAYRHTCQYCNGASGDPVMEWEHINPKSRGGSDRLKNSTLACHTCNHAKGDRTAKEWFDIISAMKKKSELDKARLTGIQNVLKEKDFSRAMSDIGVINAIRWKMYEVLKETGLPIECGTGGLTKYNRTKRGLPKDHCIDAACVGKSTPEVLKFKTNKVLVITAQGHGKHCRTVTDKNGFPKGYYAKQKEFFGFRSGDMVKAVVPAGKKQGVHIGAVACRKSGSFDIRTGNGRVAGIGYKYIRLIQRNDGYNYSLKAIATF